MTAGAYAMTTRSRDVNLLHPLFRSQVSDLLDRCGRAGLPVELYEGFRHPARQAALYATGRTTGVKGKIVTYARPWQSFHQFGLAADLVFRIEGAWTWLTASDPRWVQFADLAKACGLVTLKTERPHVQADGLLATLRSGTLPRPGPFGGPWYDAILDACEAWPDGAPPLEGRPCVEAQP